MKSQNHWQTIKPSDVLAFTEPTKDFLCPQEANTFGIEFVHFKIRDYETNDTLIEITKKPEDIGKHVSGSHKIRYNFEPSYFSRKIIGTTLRFKIGPKPLKNFKLIARHYFRNRLLKSFEFDAPFCMPGSTNEFQSIYELPQLSKQEINEMVNSPWETVSDAFYFVGERLIMHNKGEYSYVGTGKKGGLEIGMP